MKARASSTLRNAALVVLLLSAARTASAEATACAQDQVDKIVADLEQWSRRYHENERRAYAERQCQRPDVICLDRFGELGDDKLPDRLPTGAQFSVYVIVPAVDSGSLSIVLAPVAHHLDPVDPDQAKRVVAAPPSPDGGCDLSTSQRDALRAAAMPIARLGSRPGLERLQIPAEAGTDAYWSATANIVKGWSAFLDAHRDPPGFAAVGARWETPHADVLNIELARAELGARSPSIEKRYAVAIDNGVYHLEVGLLVPFVYKGSRSIERVPVPASGDTRIAVNDDWHVTGAVALDYFPMGRARSVGTSFRNCRSRSCWENWFGIQAAAGFGDILREWYLGLLFEPVSGLNLDLGASLLKGDFLPTGRAEGMQLPQGTPVGETSRYMLRPYIGFSLTLDLLETIDRRKPPIGRLF